SAHRKERPQNEGITTPRKKTRATASKEGHNFHGGREPREQAASCRGFLFHQGGSRPSSSASRRFGWANSPSSRVRVAGSIPPYSRSKIRGYASSSSTSTPRKSSTRRYAPAVSAASSSVSRTSTCSREKASNQRSSCSA